MTKTFEILNVIHCDLFLFGICNFLLLLVHFLEICRLTTIFISINFNHLSLKILPRFDILVNSHALIISADQGGCQF